MHVVKSARTPLGSWQYFPALGLNVFDTEDKGESWRPLIVSIALTGLCYKGCPFCYASSTRAGATTWRFRELVDFIVDLDRNGVFSVTLGGGEPTLWRDEQVGKDFYDLMAALHEQLSLSLSVTTSGIPTLQLARLPDVPLRLSCHDPAEAPALIEKADRDRQAISQVGITLLLWRSKLDACRQAVTQFLTAGYSDILLLTMQPTGFGVNFAHETLSTREIEEFLQRLTLDAVRLTACHAPPRTAISADMGCGANDWFISITENKVVKSCSFIDSGEALAEPTYAALLAATQRDLPRLPCYRSYATSQIANI
ncbi:MAG: hypothetical protein R3A44_38075 [Caldilineaceae bacterium]